MYGFLTARRRFYVHLSFKSLWKSSQQYPVFWMNKLFDLFICMALLKTKSQSAPNIQTRQTNINTRYW